VAWEEDGNPRNVVLRKNVTNQSGSELRIGDLCDVKVQEGAKKARYKAKLLGIGEYTHITKLCMWFLQSW
jgi:hypothetical protein